MAISFSVSEIIALCFESVTYGIFVTLFAISCRVFAQRYKDLHILNIALMLTSCLLFILITWHIIIDLLRLFTAFQLTTIAEADRYYLDFRATLSVMKSAVYAAITILSDAFIMSRTYIIWSRSKTVMILPTILFFGDIATGIAAVVSLAELDPTQNIFLERQAGFTLSFFAITVSLNGLCTGLIAWRIWSTQRKTARFVQILNAKKTTKLGAVTAMILESGAIYSVALVLVVTSYATQSSAAFNIFLDLTSPIIGLVFSMIIVRASLGYTPEGAPPSVSTVEFATHPPARGSNAGNAGPVGSCPTFELASLSRGGSIPKAVTSDQSEDSNPSKMLEP